MLVTRVVRTNYNPSMRWSLRNKWSGYSSILRRNTRRFLRSLYGNDIVSMLDNVLTINEKRELNNKYITSLEYISGIVNNNSIVKTKASF